MAIAWEAVKWQAGETARDVTVFTVKTGLVLGTLTGAGHLSKQFLFDEIPHTHGTELFSPESIKEIGIDFGVGFFEVLILNLIFQYIGSIRSELQRD